MSHKLVERFGQGNLKADRIFKERKAKIEAADQKHGIKLTPAAVFVGYCGPMTSTPSFMLVGGYYLD